MNFLTAIQKDADEHHVDHDDDDDNDDEKFVRGTE